MGSWVPVVSLLDHSAIIAAYKAGMSVSDIASEHGARDYHIRKIIKDAGLQIIRGRLRSSYVPHNKIDIESTAIINMVKDGKTFKDVAEHFKCSINVVRQRCYAVGIKSPGFSFEQATNLQSQIGELAFQKLNDKEWLYDVYIVQQKPSRLIASEIGCGKKAVLSALSRHNIKKRKGICRVQFVSESSKCHNFWCDSYWEWEIAGRLDQDNKVVKFIREPFPLEYFVEGKRKLYLPDFLIILKEDQWLIEVKPDGLLKYVEEKTKVANRSMFKFCVLNNKDQFPW